MSPATVDETTLAAALESLAAEGVTATSTENDPVEELRAIPGVYLTESGRRTAVSQRAMA
jgi:hypothetical protein